MHKMLESNSWRRDTSAAQRHNDIPIADVVICFISAWVGECVLNTKSISIMGHLHDDADDENGTHMRPTKSQFITKLLYYDIYLTVLCDAARAHSKQ